MDNFIAKEYKEILASSTTCESCEKVPMKKLTDNESYIFISYSHKDYKKVYNDLADLYESNIPFWYDCGLPAGQNWDDVVREKMTDSRCAGIIFYISENLFLSRSIQTEIEIACGQDTKSTIPGIRRKYFCVNLTDKRPSKILKHVFSDKQFPDVEDEMSAQSEWVNTLTTAFPDKATYLPFDNPSHKTNLVQQISLNFGIEPDYNPFDFGDAIFRSGKAIIEFKTGAIYNGSFLNGVFSKEGTITFPDGMSYTGEWMNGKRHGKGTMTSPDGMSYDGEWENDNRHGNGTMIYPDGMSYVGEWADGSMQGKGTLTSPSGLSYVGEWADDRMHGKGTMNFPNGGSYTGEWINGNMHGHGTMIFSNGTSYSGEWENDNMNGHGTATFPDGGSYTGEWTDDVPHGRGTITLPDGSQQTGSFKNGEFVEATE